MSICREHKMNLTSFCLNKDCTLPSPAMCEQCKVSHRHEVSEFFELSTFLRYFDTTSFMTENDKLSLLRRSLFATGLNSALGAIRKDFLEALDSLENSVNLYLAHFEYFAGKEFNLASARIMSHIEKQKYSSIVREDLFVFEQDYRSGKHLSHKPIQFSASAYRDGLIELKQLVVSVCQATKQVFSPQVRAKFKLQAQPDNLKTIEQLFNNEIGFFSRAEESQQTKPISIKKILKEAIKAESSGDLIQALELYDEAVNLDPRNSNAVNNRGIVLKNLKRYQEAIQSFDIAFKIKPDWPVPLINRGNCYKAIGNHEEAIRNYNRAIDLDPDSSSAMYNKALSLTAIKKYDDAIQILKAAQKVNPKDSDFFVLEGISWASLNKFERAKQAYKNAIMLNAGNDEAYFNMTLTLMKVGDYAGARDSLNQALNLKPSDPEYRAKHEELMQLYEAQSRRRVQQLGQ